MKYPKVLYTWITTVHRGTSRYIKVRGFVLPSTLLYCGKSDAMPPDEFWTELCDSLTAFYDNILKKSGAGGRPAAKNLS